MIPLSSKRSIILAALLYPSLNLLCNKEALAFLNVARQLIIGLGKVEQKQADEIQQAIDKYRNK